MQKQINKKVPSAHFLINKNEINIAQTLKCGQIFSYEEKPDKIIIFSKDKKAEVVELEKYYKVFADDIDYFKKFFDLKTNYNKIKQSLILQGEEILSKAVQFGEGIRILKQDLLEVIISFVFSANNNIKRITASLLELRKKFGTKIDDYSAFPTLSQLSKISENDFKAIGAGYRSIQLVKLVKQLEQIDLKELNEYETEKLRTTLINLSGIGPKVADCILLFGFARTDVFPVDTWIKKVYNQYFQKLECPKPNQKITSNKNAKKDIALSTLQGKTKQKSNLKKSAKKEENITEIRKNLINKFGNLSGYAQQYLFYFQRSFIGK